MTPSMRIENGVERDSAFTFTLDGQTMVAFPGETIAAALLAAGLRTLRRTDKGNSQRGVFCGMGVCFDCLVTVDGRPHMRACLTCAEPNMNVTTQDENNWRHSR